MKLLRAKFQNFRLLRDLELEFSNDSKKNLTVIRAANESGKTTILHALQWCFYGDTALPGKGEGFRLHPIDWEASEGNRIPINAMVEFEVTNHRRVSGELRETRQRYRLVRSAYEDLDSKSRRTASSVKLQALRDIGATNISAPESIIDDELPPELREVFFTDGDRALSFIEADVALSTKRDRVQRAIRSLLGLGVIDNAINHVRKSMAEANRKAKRVSTSTELNQIASDLEEMEKEREKLEADLEDAKQQFDAFEEKINEIDRKVAAALKDGDREELQKDLELAKVKIGRLDSQLASAIKDHAGLFRSRYIASDLLAPVFAEAFKQLEALHEQGKIPNTTIPVLEDRLSCEVCICGETLSVDDPIGKKRRSNIQELIDNTHHADEIQEIVTDLYYSSKPLQAEGDNNSSAWLNDYTGVVERRDGIQTLRDDAGRELSSLNKKLDLLPDTDIQGLRATCRQFKDQRDRFLSKRATCEALLANLKRDQGHKESHRDQLLREQKKGARILAELAVTQDVTKILKSAYERITNEELQKVSDLMNSIFLEMIGADPDLGAIIRRTEISQEFDIVVYGPLDRVLNPDRDLNGASRRALTLAFILALTRVSEVEAPNVIDTPLGMTSGFVKRSILRTAVRESAQLILFLTHDEIAGCEEIIDESAGVVCTLTNPVHFPRMLVSDPGVEEHKILRCTCDHRNECDLCQRRLDTEIELEKAS